MPRYLLVSTADKSDQKEVEIPKEIIASSNKQQYKSAIKLAKENKKQQKAISLLK